MLTLREAIERWKIHVKEPGCDSEPIRFVQNIAIDEIYRIPETSTFLTRTAPAAVLMMPYRYPWI